MSRRQQVLKRALDLTVASSSLVLSAPLLTLIAALIWVVSGRPVLYRQVRPGLRGRPFTLYKFRTMTEPTGKHDPAEDAARLTGLGRWLRRTSLDELPELWNVVKGEMSLVGPRPLLVEYLDRYSEDQNRRHEVKPGLTGWAQIHGRNLVSWDERFALDLWYVEHQSLWLDLRILCKTMRLVVSGHGVSADGHATMPPFRGTKSTR